MRRRESVHWSPLAAICLGTFMQLIDVTIVNVALPSTASDLHASFGAVQWVVDGYALALAATLMGLGTWADRVGHRRFFLAGAAAFALASIACGASPDIAVLIVARIVQGLAAAAMAATTFALLNATYRGEHRATAYGVWSAVAGAAFAIAPLIGGPLTQALSWRAVFFVNAPVALVTVLLSRRLPAVGGRASAPSVDVPGVVTFTIALVALVFGLIDADQVGWGDARCWGALLAAAAAGGLFLAIERRTPSPMVDLELLRNRTFTGVLIVATLVNAAAYVSLTYGSIWMQSVLRTTPVLAGLSALPMSAASFLVPLLFARRLQRVRPEAVIGVSLLLIASGDLVGGVLVRLVQDWPALLPGYLLVGLGIGAITPVLTSTGTGSVAAQRGGMAGGAINTARQLGFSAGVAILGAVFAMGAATRLGVMGVPDAGAAGSAIAGGRYLVYASGLDPHHRLALVDASTTAAAAGMSTLLLVAGSTALVASVFAVTLIRRRRDDSAAVGEATASGPSVSA
ncbi:MFS transporter [Amnibacterium kyonggiense]